MADRNRPTFSEATGNASVIAPKHTGSRPDIHRYSFPVERFIRETKATAAIEFAFFGMLTISLVLEIMQAGLFFYSSFTLEHALDRATRLIETGYVVNQKLSADQFRSNVLCSFLPAGLICSNIITNISAATAGASTGNGFYAFVKPDKSDIIQPAMNNNQTTFCPGSPQTYVYAQAFYAMPVISPIWKAIASTNWNGMSVHFVSASTVFVNQPYISTATSKSC